VHFSLTTPIDAPRDAVEAALADPRYYAFLGASLANLAAPELLEATVRADVLSLAVRHAFAGTVSGPAAMVVDEAKLTWVIETTIDLTRHAGTVVVVPDHYDGLLTCSADLTLDVAGTGTIERVAGELTVRVPLIASKAEEAIIGGLERHLALEAAALERYLAEA
jgi:hypothetical protein